MTSIWTTLHRKSLRGNKICQRGKMEFNVCLHSVHLSKHQKCYMSVQLFYSFFFFSEGKTSLFEPDMHLGRCSRRSWISELPKCVIIFARKVYLAEADKGMMLDWSKADMIKHSMIRKSYSNTVFTILHHTRSHRF